MQKKSDRKGLALGAIFALVLSLFGSVPAAQAATDGSDIGIYPSEGSTFTGTVVSDFPIYAGLKQTSTTNQFNASNVVVKVEKIAGLNMDVVWTQSQTADLSSADSASADANGDSILEVIAATTAATSSSTASASLSPTSIIGLNFKADSTSAVASWSPVTLKVTIWIDNQGGVKNDVVDSDELFTTQLITLLAPTAIGGSITIGSLAEGDDTVTVSATASGVNLANIRGGFFLAMSSSHAIYDLNGASTVSQISGPDSVSNAALALRSGVLSSSIPVQQVSASETISGALRYLPTWDGSAVDYEAGYLVSTVVNTVVASPAVDTLYAAVASANNATASAGTVVVRPNQTYTIKAGASTGSASASGVVLSVGLSGPALSLPGSFIKVNGGAATTSYPTAVAVTTDATGFGSFTLETSGLVGSSDNIVATVTYLNVDSAQVTLQHATSSYTVVNEFDLYSATPSSNVALNFDVEDQWQVASPRTDQRIKLTRAGTGFDYGTATYSYHVVAAGAVATTFAVPALTGSALVTPELQRYNQDAGVWETMATGTQITINVTEIGSQFLTVSALATTSASISYNMADELYSWSGNIVVTGTVAGADVTVTAPGLHIYNNGNAKSASGTLVVRTDSSNQISVKFAGASAGDHTVSFTTGAGTTTSTVVIDAAAADAGSAISYNLSNIAQGSTARIIGTLVDDLGNPVFTTGSPSIQVVYAGAGIALGTMPTETDADGEFAFNVIVGANDSGTATVTVTYLRDGDSTAAARKLTTVNQITVGAESVASADQKITVGTFKGYVAIYTKGYMGQKLSAKVAGKWLVVDPIVAFKSNDYSRTVRLTGAGYTITVDLYIDGAFVRSEVVTTK